MCVLGRGRICQRRPRPAPHSCVTLLCAGYHPSACHPAICGPRAGRLTPTNVAAACDNCNQTLFDCARDVPAADVHPCAHAAAAVGCRPAGRAASWHALGRQAPWRAPRQRLQPFLTLYTTCRPCWLPPTDEHSPSIMRFVLRPGAAYTVVMCACDSGSAVDGGWFQEGCSRALSGCVRCLPVNVTAVMQVPTMHPHCSTCQST